MTYDKSTHRLINRTSLWSPHLRAFRGHVNRVLCIVMLLPAGRGRDSCLGKQSFQIKLGFVISPCPQQNFTTLLSQFSGFLLAMRVFISVLLLAILAVLQRHNASHEKMVANSLNNLTIFYAGAQVGNLRQQLRVEMATELPESRDHQYQKLSSAGAKETLQNNEPKFRVLKKGPRPPTRIPTKRPTKRPTMTPTKAPTKPPTKKPTKAPSKQPTTKPTNTPTKSPTQKIPDVKTSKPTATIAPSTKPPTSAPTLHSSSPSHKW